MVMNRHVPRRSEEPGNWLGTICVPAGHQIMSTIRVARIHLKSRRAIDQSPGQVAAGGFSRVLG